MILEYVPVKLFRNRNNFSSGGTSNTYHMTHARHFLTKTWYIDFVYKNHSFIYVSLFFLVHSCSFCVCVHFIWWTYQIKCSLKRTEVVFVRLTWTIFLSTSHILARIIYNYLHMLFAFILIQLWCEWWVSECFFYALSKSLFHVLADSQLNSKLMEYCFSTPTAYVTFCIQLPLKHSLHT